MNEIPSNVARRQADVCLALVQEIDQAVGNSRQPADQILARLYRQHREYGARDRRFFSNAVFSWFRWRGWLKTPTNENVAAAILLDADEVPPQLEYFGLNSPSKDLKPAGRLTLEQKAEYLQHLLNISALQIEELRQRGKSCPNSGGNAAVLSSDESDKSIDSAGQPCPAGTAQPDWQSGPTFLKFPYLDLSPDWVSDSLFIPADCKPETHLRQCLESFQTRPPTWLRLRSDRKCHQIHLLAQMGIETGNHPLIENAVFIKGQKNCDLSQLPGVEAQDLASQCVGICCNPKPGEKWWDVCAGAGGKSLHLADLMQDNGVILATDVRTSILNQLSKRLKRNKYRSIRMSAWNGIADPAPEVYFDGVLIDAPCSSLGTWARNSDARWRIFAGQINEHAGIQNNLLQIAAGKVRPGGRLVYATCTLTKTENTDVILHFLAAHSEFQLEQIINPLDNRPSDGIIWIWPWEWNCNGMFIAVMKKGPSLKVR